MPWMKHKERAVLRALSLQGVVIREILYVSFGDRFAALGYGDSGVRGWMGS